MKKAFFLIMSFVLFSCQDHVQPKPKGFLALHYPKPEYKLIGEGCPYTFEINKNTVLKPSRSHHDCWVDITYPNMHGTIFISYKPVRDNLKKLLIDAQKLPLEHTIKADEIEGDIYTNDLHKTYGIFYEISGNAASQAQFYLTDSVQHFLTGSIYFSVEPDYDSIIPAADYLKKDIRHLMESVEWK